MHARYQCVSLSSLWGRLLTHENGTSHARSPRPATAAPLCAIEDSMFFRRSLFVLLVCGGCAADAGSSRSPQLDVDASWLRPDAGRAEPGDAGGRDAATH